MDEQDPALASRLRELIGHLIFLGFNSRVVALDRATGNILWNWKCPQGTSEYVALLLDGDQLVVSVQGYTYCLNPLTGEEIWRNPLKGFGVGVPTMVSINASSSGGAAAEEIRRQQQQANNTHPDMTT
jgi:outer membrane protein assembly factor BamB